MWSKHDSIIAKCMPKMAWYNVTGKDTPY